MVERVPLRVLVVDDFETSRRWVYSKIATHEQLQVVGEAVDGLAAVQKAQELIPDLILMDIGLPDLNGIDAARRICHLVPSAKILFLTQNVDVDVVKARDEQWSERVHCEGGCSKRAFACGRGGHGWGGGCSALH